MNKKIKNLQTAVSGVMVMVLALVGCAPTLSLPPPRSAPLPLAATSAAPTPAAELMLAWPNGMAGGPIAYDTVTGTPQFELPAGRADVFNKRYFAAREDNNTTSIKTYTLHNGQEVGSLPLPGHWQVSGLSPNGLYVAVSQLSTAEERQAWAKQDTWQTRLQVLDMNTQQVKHTLNLPGNFEVETISNDGHSLFMLEHLPVAKPDHYNVRQLDLWTERLSEYPLREKGSDEVMAGYAWDSVASNDGTWLMTLYLNSNKHEAFVHALNLDYSMTVCIDLPSGDGALEQLKQYRLTLSPDSKMLYAANAALGIMTEIALDDSTYPPYQVVHTEHFQPMAIDTANVSPFTHSTFSPDAKTLYFTSANTAWAYDLTQHQVSRLPVEGALFGLGTSADGKRLYVNREKSVVPLDLPTSVAMR